MITLHQEREKHPNPLLNYHYLLHRNMAKLEWRDKVGVDEGDAVVLHSPDWSGLSLSDLKERTRPMTLLLRHDHGRATLHLSHPNCYYLPLRHRGAGEAQPGRA